MKMDSLTQNEIKNIVDLYNNGSNLIQIALEYKSSSRTIGKILKNNNIKIRDGSYFNKKFLHENIFENIDSKEKAYWLGFLAADGNISKTGQLTLQLAEKDLNHLMKFYNFMGGKSKIIKTSTKIKDKIYYGYRVGFRSLKLKNDLEKFNIVSNKSKNLKISQNIPQQFLSSFILGLIDGDGSFFFSNNKLNFCLISSQEACSQVMDYFVNNIKLNKINLYSASCAEMKYLKYCGNNNVYKIAKFLYSSNTPVFLERKKQVIIDNLPTKYIRDF
jgi:alpha-glucuronidase